MRSAPFHILRSTVLCLAMFSLGCSESDSGSDTRISLLHQNVNRFVHLHIPEGYEADKPTPVLIALHGSADTGGHFQQGAGLDKQADKHGFIVAYPSASTNNWAEGCNCNRPDLDGVDDVGFLDKAIEELDVRYNIDRDRLFVVGFSQGGMFAQRLACERSGTFKSFSTVAAMISEPLSRACKPSEPVSMMMINGTADAVLPFYGIASGSFATKGVFETMLMWADRNECTGNIETQNYRPSGPTTVLHSVSGCTNAEVKAYVIVEGGHEWPRGKIDSPELLTEFFKLDR
jgi:polyhydroxybutyrate depolymerase